MKNNLTSAKKFAKKNMVQIVDNGFTYKYLTASPSPSEAEMTHPTNMCTTWIFRDGSRLSVTDGDVFVNN